MRTLALGIRTLSLSLLVACGQSEAVDSSAPELPALDVWTVDVRQETIVEPIVGTGSIGSHKRSNIGPRVDGFIEEVFVRVGDRVESGAPLFRTRDINYRIRVKEAEHVLRLARAEAHKASRDKKRIEERADEGVVSTEQLDAVHTTDEIGAAWLGAAKTALGRARQNLADTLVVAPFCLGASLARLEARVALEELFGRCKQLERTTSQVEWIDSLILRGPNELPLQFDA